MLEVHLNRLVWFIGTNGIVSRAELDQTLLLVFEEVFRCPASVNTYYLGWGLMFCLRRVLTVRGTPVLCWCSVGCLCSFGSFICERMFSVSLNEWRHVTDILTSVLGWQSQVKEGVGV